VATISRSHFAAAIRQPAWRGVTLECRAVFFTTGDVEVPGAGVVVPYGVAARGISSLLSQVTGLRLSPTAGRSARSTHAR
jgi:hypothetical protein